MREGACVLCKREPKTCPQIKKGVMVVEKKKKKKPKIGST